MLCHHLHAGHGKRGGECTGSSIGQLKAGFVSLWQSATYGTYTYDLASKYSAGERATQASVVSCRPAMLMCTSFFVARLCDRCEHPKSLLSHSLYRRGSSEVFLTGIGVFA